MKAMSGETQSANVALDPTLISVFCYQARWSFMFFCLVISIVSKLCVQVFQCTAKYAHYAIDGLTSMSIEIQ